ncbi:MAG TPA: diacylglycerol kinase family protein [Saprospiraceae bacterium]|nr:diacylglycerol kinase family protein [Saprospiraceae bacterium]
MKLVLLYNSFSGNGKGKQLAEKMKASLLSRGLAFDAFENQWPAELSLYSEALLFGGDGTLNYFINRYGVLSLPLTLFPGGTGNDVHWKLFGNVDADTQIHTWPDYQPKAIDVGVCNDEYFVNMVGIGFDGEVLKKMKAIRWIGGHLGYLSVVIRLIFSFVENNLTLSWDNHRKSQPCLLCQVSNSSRTGGGFMVAPHAKIDDGLLNLTFCGAKSILGRLLFLPKVEKGKHLSVKGVETYPITKVRIEAPGAIPYQLDGELRTGNCFDFKLADQKLLVRSAQ